MNGKKRRFESAHLHKVLFIANGTSLVYIVYSLLRQLHQEPHHIRWSDTLEMCIRVRSCERSWCTYALALLSFDFISMRFDFKYKLTNFVTHTQLSVLRVSGL